MRHGVCVVTLLGWCGPADAVSWIAGDYAALGDDCALFAGCDSCSPSFDDGAADGRSRLMLKDDGAAGADVQVTSALVSVGVADRRIVLALMLGHSLLVAGRSSYWSAVTVQVGLLLGTVVGGLHYQHLVGQASDVGEASAWKCGIVAVGLSDTELLSCP